MRHRGKASPAWRKSQRPIGATGVSGVCSGEATECGFGPTKGSEFPLATEEEPTPYRGMSNAL